MSWNISRWLGKCGCNISITLSRCIRCIDDTVEIELIVGDSPITLSYTFESLLTPLLSTNSTVSIKGDNDSLITIDLSLDSDVLTEEMKASLIQIITTSIGNITIENNNDSTITEQLIIESLIEELKNNISNQTNDIQTQTNIEINSDNNSNII